MTKRKANVRPDLIGELFTDGTDYFKLIDCQSEPSATFENIDSPSPDKNVITKSISEFANFVQLKPVRPIVKPATPRKIRSDAGKPRERNPKPTLINGVFTEIKDRPDLVIEEDPEPVSPPAEVLEEPKKRGRKIKRDKPEIVDNDKKGDNLFIHVPTGLGEDTDYKVNIAGSRARGDMSVGVRVVVLAALDEFGGKIPDELSDYERKTIEGILKEGG